MVLVLPALFAELITVHNPRSGMLADQLKPPFWLSGGTLEFPLGTDRQGRDVLTRIIFGARVSAVVAAIGVTASAVLGTALGLLAGFKGGFVDTVIMRGVDMTLAFPAVLFAIAIATVLGPGFSSVLLVIIFVKWAYFARQIRGEVIPLMAEDFIAIARINGQTPFRTITAHLLPNVLNSVVVLATLQFGSVIVLEATLSFLGVGLARPSPAWGLMIADGRDLIIAGWWLALFPGLALTVSVIAMNAWGDRLRDVIDVRSSR